MYHAINQRRHTMSKLLSALFISTLLLTQISIYAEDRRSQDRHEMRELKQQENELRAKQRLLQLKSALNLQADQEQAWDKYEISILENMSQKREMTTQLRQKYRNTDQKPNALELAQANISRLESKLADTKDQYLALEEFYNFLNDEQKQMIDKVVQRKIKNAAKKLRKMIKN
jgi:hypothetical protein